MNFTLEELSDYIRSSKVFVSMPYYPGLTPRYLCGKNSVEENLDEPLLRRSGIFQLDEACLSPVDHGNLYGDAVFEGIRIQGGRIIALREHVERWFRSAEGLCIRFPYTKEKIIRIIHNLVVQTLENPRDTAYLRPVITRGMGDLGVGYKKCLPPSIYIICSKVSLYPPEFYTTGISLAIARKTRRNAPQFLNPNLKTNNYLNNVQALLETRQTVALETLMLTEDGYVAEATADNIFLVTEASGHVCVRCPAAHYALVGITRGIVMECARELGYEVLEDPHILPSDLVGANREVFITGTAAGIIPIIAIDHNPVGDGKPGIYTQKLIEAVEKAYRRPSLSLSVGASEQELSSYAQFASQEKDAE